MRDILSGQKLCSIIMWTRYYSFNFDFKRFVICTYFRLGSQDSEPNKMKAKKQLQSHAICKMISINITALLMVLTIASTSSHSITKLIRTKLGNQFLFNLGKSFFMKSY